VLTAFLTKAEANALTLLLGAAGREIRGRLDRGAMCIDARLPEDYIVLCTGDGSDHSFLVHRLGLSVECANCGRIGLSVDLIADFYRRAPDNHRGTGRYTRERSHEIRLQALWRHRVSTAEGYRWQVRRRMLKLWKGVLVRSIYRMQAVRISIHAR
jgi:hypothetical protein